MTVPSSVADLAALVDLLPQATLVHDVAGELVAANRAGKDVLADRIDPIGGTLPWRACADGAATVDLRVDSREGVTRWMTAQSTMVGHGDTSVVVTTILDSIVSIRPDGHVDQVLLLRFLEPRGQEVERPVGTRRVPNRPPNGTPGNAKILATTYFPERLPSQYLRRWRA